MGCGPQETFRSCADIEITRHPLLSNSIAGVEDESFYNDALLESQSGDLDDLGDLEPAHHEADWPPLRGHHRDQLHDLEQLSSIKRKKALLRKKKRLLEQLLRKLRQLIIQSQQLEAATSEDGGWNNDDQMTSPQRTVSQIQLPDEERAAVNDPNSFTWQNGGGKVIPWWERIKSNRH